MAHSLYFDTDVDEGNSIYTNLNIKYDNCQVIGDSWVPTNYDKDAEDADDVNMRFFTSSASRQLKYVLNNV